MIFPRGAFFPGPVCCSSPLDEGTRVGSYLNLFHAFGAKCQVLEFLDIQFFSQFAFTPVFLCSILSVSGAMQVYHHNERPHLTTTTFLTRNDLTPPLRKPVLISVIACFFAGFLVFVTFKATHPGMTQIVDFLDGC